MLADLAVPRNILGLIEPAVQMLSWEDVKDLLPKRSKLAHKRNFGCVLAIGGAPGMGGAIRLAAEASLLVGAGLVTIATHPSHAAVITSQCPELLCYGVADGRELEPLLQRVDAVILGPGLSQTKWGVDLWLAAIQLIPNDIPILLDADGLNNLAKYDVSLQQSRIVLTPHSGEAARLLSVSAQEIEQDRFDALLQLTHKFTSTTVLKGAGTLMAAPVHEDKTVKQVPAVCIAGNSGMATAGTGDVLSGIIIGFIAQRLDIYDAVKLGVCLHATSGDMAANIKGQRSMTAMDLLQAIPMLLRDY